MSLDDFAPDLETALLIAQLSLSDIDGPEARKGRGDGSISDEELAIQAQAESIRSLLDLLRDYRFALSLDDTQGNDAPVLQAYADNILSLLGPLQDYCLSCGPEGVYNADCPSSDAVSTITGICDKDLPEPPPYEENLFQSPLDDVESGFEFMERSGEESDASGSGSLPEPGPSTSRQVARVCMVCWEPVTTTGFQAPCGDSYCSDCLVVLVDLAARDETSYPPRCCGYDLSIHEIAPFISSGLLARFCAKSLEFGTPPASRVYCANPRCSTFLAPEGDYLADIVCPLCFYIVCSGCKNAAHPGETCVEHTGLLELKELAQTNRWQTCPGCNAIVERNGGCPHLICRCDTQFCYLCAKPWKTCPC